MPRKSESVDHYVHCSTKEKRRGRSGARVRRQDVPFCVLKQRALAPIKISAIATHVPQDAQTFHRRFYYLGWTRLGTLEDFRKAVPMHVLRVPAKPPISMSK